MMFVSPHLGFDPTEDLSPEVEVLCNLQAEIPPEVNLFTFAAGQHWVAPLGRSGGNVLVGLRLVPGRALAQCPVVEVEGAQAVTIASSPAHLVPVRLHERLRQGGAAWDELAALDDERWAALVALHHKLGGQGQLEAVRALLSDAGLRQLYDGGGDRKAQATARAEVLQRLDPSPETAAYARYLARAGVDRVAPTPVPEAGGWTDSLCTLALYASQHDPEDEPHRDDESWAAWRVAQQLPGLDTARVGLGLVPGLRRDAGAALALGAAKVVVKRARPEWQAGPLWPAIERLAHEPDYDGLAHLEAAAALERAGEAAAAFTALAASSYWEVVARGEATRDALAPACALARRAGWTELADSLEELQTLRQDVLAEVGAS